jgi:hypothetical protein
MNVHNLNFRPVAALPTFWHTLQLSPSGWADRYKGPTPGLWPIPLPRLIHILTMATKMLVQLEHDMATLRKLRLLRKSREIVKVTNSWMWLRSQIKSFTRRNHENPAAIFHWTLQAFGISRVCTYKGSSQIYILARYHMHQLITEEKTMCSKCIFKEK